MAAAPSARPSSLRERLACSAKDEGTMLRLGLTRVSSTHHRLDITRNDGSCESVTLETRSALEHDFIHLALETEAALKHAFFGLLDQGWSYAELSGKEPRRMPSEREAFIAEAVIGGLTRFVFGQADDDAEAIISRIKDYLIDLGERVPDWLTPELASCVKERFPPPKR
jgi:hypothetical protein